MSEKFEDLVHKVSETQSKKKKKPFDYLSPDSDMKLLTDEEIAAVLGKRADRLRKKMKIKQTETNLAQTTYSKFANTGEISLVRFIKVLRALGRVDELEKLLRLTISDEIAALKNKVDGEKKRVR